MGPVEHPQLSYSDQSATGSITVKRHLLKASVMWSWLPVAIPKEEENVEPVSQVEGKKPESLLGELRKKVVDGAKETADTRQLIQEFRGELQNMRTWTLQVTTERELPGLDKMEKQLEELQAEKQEVEIKLEATKTALDETLVMLENLENVTTQEGTTITKEVQEKTKEIVQLKQELQEARLKCNSNEKELKEKMVELDSLKEKIKTGMKVMEKQEEDFKRVSRQLAEVKEEMANSNGSLNPTDLAEKMQRYRSCAANSRRWRRLAEIKIESFWSGMES